MKTASSSVDFPEHDSGKSGASSRRRYLVPLLVPLLLLVAWVIGTEFGWVPPQILPKPDAVAEAALDLAHTRLTSDLAISTERAFGGFAIGAALGLLFGMFNGLSHLGEQLFDTTIHMVRTIPHLALIPLIIIWFGLGEATKVVLVALGVFFPVYLNTFHGIQNVDPGLIETGKVYGLRGWRLFAKVILPSALPSILIGIRFALGIMWLTLIVSETIGTTAGIGFLANNAREYMQTEVVVFLILLYAFLGKGADVLARLLERLLLPWHHAYAPSRRR